MGFGIPRDNPIEILTREHILDELCMEWTIMSIVLKLCPDCPLTYSALFAVICAKRRKIMSIMGIHPLDIIIHLNREIK